MIWMKQIYIQWKRRKTFRAKLWQLTKGMLPNAVEELPGRPDQITDRDELIESWYEWRYSEAIARRKDFVLLFGEQSSLQSWHTEQLRDGTVMIEVRARIKKR